MNTTLIMNFAEWMDKESVHVDSGIHNLIYCEHITELC